MSHRKYPPCPAAGGMMNLKGGPSPLGWAGGQGSWVRLKYHFGAFCPVQLQLAGAKHRQGKGALGGNRTAHGYQGQGSAPRTWLDSPHLKPSHPRRTSSRGPGHLAEALPRAPGDTLSMAGMGVGVESVFTPRGPPSPRIVARTLPCKGLGLSPLGPHAPGHRAGGWHDRFQVSRKESEASSQTRSSPSGEACMQVLLWGLP